MVQDTEREHSVKRILDAAELEFGKHGMHGIDIATISRRAQVSPQLIYHYFSNKDNLYAETVFRLTETFFRHYADLDLGSKTPAESIHHFAYHFCHFFMEKPGMGRLVLDQTLREDPGPQRDVRAEPRMKKVFAILKAKIDEGVEAGMFRDDLTPETLFFATLVNTVGYTTLTDFAGRMHLQKPEICGPRDVRMIVADAVIGAVVRHAAADGLRPPV